MATHEMKCWPSFFDAIAAGRLRFQLRKADRDFRPGDTLRLKEFDPKAEAFTGRALDVDVPYLMAGPILGVEAGYVLMSIGEPRPVPTQAAA